MYVRIGITYSDSEFSALEKSGNKYRKVSSEPCIKQVREDSIFPGCVICFLEVKEYSLHMLTISQSLSYPRVQSNQLICCTAPLPEATLKFGNDIVLLHVVN